MANTLMAEGGSPAPRPQRVAAAALEHLHLHLLAAEDPPPQQRVANECEFLMQKLIIFRMGLNYTGLCLSFARYSHTNNVIR